MFLEEWKELLATSAVITTVLQFLTGILVCQRFVNKGTTGDVSGFPFICGLLSASLWLRYGFLIGDNSVILVNTIGSTLQLAYCVTYYLYSIKKSTILRQFLLVVIVLFLTILYSIYEPDHKTAVRLIGLMCCAVTVVFFAAPLASLLHVLKVKSTESLPFPIIVSSFLVSLQWFCYGLIINDMFLQVPNAMGVALSSFQLSLYLCFPNSAPKSAGYTPVIQPL